MTQSGDRDAARGQYRTTQTEWSRVPKYVRFRYQRALERLPASGTVIELGAGIGVGLAHLARSRPDLRFRGFEMSDGAVAYGNEHFGDISNLSLEVLPDMPSLAKTLARARHPDQGFTLVALEVLEHLDNATLDVFRRDVMAHVDQVIFSFPYMQQNIEGTDHLQSFDLYDIFEIFPGFETIFLRRHSIKLIGHWHREDRSFVRECLGVAGEDKAIEAIANLDAPHGAGAIPAGSALKDSWTDIQARAKAGRKGLRKVWKAFRKKTP